MGTFVSTVLTILGLSLAGVAIVGGGLVFTGRKVYISWRRPYDRAIRSLQRTSHTAVPFLHAFTGHPLFRQWMRANGKQDVQTVGTLFCATDQQTKEYILSSLPKLEKKQLHLYVKQKKNFTQEDIERTVVTVKNYLEQEYRNPAKKHELSFYELYFYEEYADVIRTIRQYRNAVNPVLQATIDRLVIAVLQSIPYYRSRRMYEQQHKFEAFLTKDLLDMLELISQLPPGPRLDKENELATYLAQFQQEFETEQTTRLQSVETALEIKMRAAKEKFYKN